jgi:hypothetical protein
MERNNSSVRQKPLENRWQMKNVKFHLPSPELIPSGVNNRVTAREDKWSGIIQAWRQNLLETDGK